MKMVLKRLSVAGAQGSFRLGMSRMVIYCMKLNLKRRSLNYYSVISITAGRGRLYAVPLMVRFLALLFRPKRIELLNVRR
jgi:hypothetical protein